MERELFNHLLWLWAIVGFLIFIVLLFITAPYGRHSRKDWGPTIPNKLGWIFMEGISLIVFILAFLLGPKGIQPVTWIFFAAYVFHYGNRSILWPLRTKTAGKRMPLVVALMAVVFNLVNGFTNGYYFSAFAREYTWEWLVDIRFILGFFSLVFWIIYQLVVRSDLIEPEKGREEGLLYSLRGTFPLDILSKFFW